MSSGESRPCTSAISPSPTYSASPVSIGTEDEQVLINRLFVRQHSPQCDETCCVTGDSDDLTVLFSSPDQVEYVNKPGAVDLLQSDAGRAVRARWFCGGVVTC